MRKISLLAFLISFFIFSYKAVYADSSQSYQIPRVDLINLEDPGVLDLTSEEQKMKAYLMFQSEDVNFIWPVMVSLENGFTLAFEKRSYLFEFFRDDSFTEPQNIIVSEDWGAHNRYALEANNYDSTLSRNAVASEIIGMMNNSSGIFPDAPNSGASDGIPVEFYVDREYRGIYVWSLYLDPWLFGMNSENENNIVLQGDNGQSPAVLFMQEIDEMENSGWKIVIGPKETPEEVASVSEKFNRVIRFVMNSSDEEFRANFADYFNLDASLNYYCFCAFTNTTDNMGKNMLMATLDGNVWYPSLYNLQTSFGLYYNGEGIYSAENRVEYFQGGSSLFWTRLAGNFSVELAERYWKMRQSLLKESLIMGLFEAYSEKIPEEAWERERELWPDVPGIEYGLESIHAHILEREPFIDEIISQILPQPEHYNDSRVIYRLELPFRGKGDNYLDTGINLYEDDMDYTIILKVKTGQQDPGTMTILSDSNGNMHGLIVQPAGNGTDEYTAFFAGEYVYEALYAMDTDGYAYLTIRKNGDEYTFYGKSLDDRRQIVSNVSTDITTNLILGGRIAYLDNDGIPVVTDFYKGRIDQCRIYNVALEDEEIAEIIAALKTE